MPPDEDGAVKQGRQAERQGSCRRPAALTPASLTYESMRCVALSHYVCGHLLQPQKANAYSFKILLTF